MMRAQTVLNGEYDILFQIAQVTPAYELEVSVDSIVPHATLISSRPQPFVESAVAVSASRGCGLLLLSKAIAAHLAAAQSYEELTMQTSRTSLGNQPLTVHSAVTHRLQRPARHWHTPN